MKNVVWVTNLAAPYRVPVWSTLALSCHLTVALFENNLTRISNGRRDATWAATASPLYRTIAMNAARFIKGERTLYITNPISVFRLLRNKDAIVIGGWDSPAYWQFLFIAKMLKVETVAFYESTSASQRHTSGPIFQLRGWFYRSVGCVVVPGTAAANAVKLMGVNRSNISTGFNAVDVMRIHHDVNSHLHSKRLASAGHKYLYIGQLIERKNAFSLLQAFKNVGGLDDSLSFVGTGNLEDDLIDYTEKLGISGQVTFHGKVTSTEISALLATHYTLVLPSREEVWGLVINEALAGGLHVVVSDRCGVAESVKHMNGVFVTGVDVDSLALGMVNSKANWQGHIAIPEILEFTPQRFAGVFLEALR